MASADVGDVSLCSDFGGNADEIASDLLLCVLYINWFEATSKSQLVRLHSYMTPQTHHIERTFYVTTKE